MTKAMVRPRATGSRTSWTMPIALVVAASLTVGVPLYRHLDDPPRAALTVRNDTVWDLTLYVRDGATTVSPIRTISAGRTARITEVIVPGETWRFIWRFEGDDVGTSEIRHRALSAEDFVLLVPDDVGDALRQRGAPPSP